MIYYLQHKSLDQGAVTGSFFFLRAKIHKNFLPEKKESWLLVPDIMKKISRIEVITST